MAADTTTTFSTNRLFSLGLLAVGITLIVLGVIASDSVSSDFSRLFTGAPTDKTVWLLIGGTLAAVVGLVGLVRG
jgi:Co/Zn/Cd efflux system component